MSENHTRSKSIILAITGGSGAPIAKRMLELLILESDLNIHLLVSENAKEVFRVESKIDLGLDDIDLLNNIKQKFALPVDRIRLHNLNDMASKVSSGSSLNLGMIIVPCSMSSLGAIANGITMNLIHRAASVMLKERRPLILVPRESPYSSIHLKNMLELTHAGATIVPATTTFYHNPKTIDDLVDFICMRVLDLLNVPHSIKKRWEGSLNESYTRI